MYSEEEMKFKPEKDGSFNIACGPHVSSDDYETLFCGWDEKPEDLELNYLENPPTTIAPLLVELGIFQSRGEARKNGWDKPFPTGWCEIRIGKLSKNVWKHNIFI